MERRDFFKGIAAAAAAAPLLPDAAAGLAERLGTLGQDVAAADSERALWQRVRREFRLNPGLVHLNCGSIGATPRVVTDALTAYLAELEGNPLANTWGGLGNEMETVRAKGAEFIGAEQDETVLTRNTTEGMNHVASGLDLQPGDEVLTTNHEHGGGMVCWQHLARTRGVVVRYIKMPNPVRDAAEIVQLVEDHLTPRTRVCSFCHIDTITGLQLPLTAIAALTQPPRHLAGLRRRTSSGDDRRRRQSTWRRYLCFQQPQVDARAQGHGTALHPQGRARSRPAGVHVFRLQRLFGLVRHPQRATDRRARGGDGIPQHHWPPAH